MVNPRPISTGQAYSHGYLSQVDSSEYYGEGNTVKGQWFGSAAAHLGLEGEVTEAAFSAILNGLHPETGGNLRMRANTSQRNASGEVINHGRSGHDFCVTSIKDLSIIYAIGGRDERLIQAHERATAAVMKEVEAMAVVRDRAGGVDAKKSAQIVGAKFTHASSRHTDPLIHSHCFIANVARDPTLDGEKGEYRSLFASDIYKSKKFLDAVYHAHIAADLRAMGYDLTPLKDSRGRDAGFGIVGISEEIRQRFSNGSKLRDEVIAEEQARRSAVIAKFKESGQPDLAAFLAGRGEKWANMSPTDFSNSEVANLLRARRPAKKVGMAAETIEDIQNAKITPEQKAQILGVQAAAAKAGPRKKNEGSEIAAIEWAVEHCLERASVVKMNTLLETAINHASAENLSVDVAKLRETVAQIESAGGLLRAGDRLTTREELDREARLFAMVDAGRGEFEPIAEVKGEPFAEVEAELTKRTNEATPEEREKLEDEWQSLRDQKKALTFVCKSRDRCTNLQGAAGTGKTFTLKTIREAIQASGRDVLGVAPSSSATEELHNAGFSAMTIAMLLTSTKEQDKLGFGGTLVVDEAGMVSLSQMHAIMSLATQKEKQWRVLFSGDVAQIQSVTAGDSLASMEKYTTLKKVSLLKVRRQEVEEYRHAIMELREKTDSGFDKLEALGAIKECASDDERAAAVAKKYFYEIAKTDRRGNQATCLVVCPTHKEIDRVSTAIRAERRTRAELGTDQARDVHTSLQWTTAQKRELSRYQPGLVLKLTRDIRGATKNSSCTVEGVDEKRGVLIVRESREGRLVEVSPSVKAGSFDVAITRQIQISKGDRILLTKSGKLRDGGKVHTGDLAEITEVKKDGGLTLKDGRILSAAFHDFTYGYAVTAHKSQGRSVTSVIVSGAQMKRELFYVAASRGRERIAIFTQDAEMLRESIRASGERESATAMVLSDEALSHIKNATLEKSRARRAGKAAKRAQQKASQQKAAHGMPANEIGNDGKARQQRTL